MPPTTRSRGVPPPSRVYHSSPPLQQAQFRPRRTTVRTYGKRRSKGEVQRLRQQTLTQIDFVSSSARKHDDDPIVLTDSDEEGFARDKENRDPQQEEEEEEEKDDRDEEQDQEPVSSGTKRKAPARSASKPAEAPKSKRRRTLGDVSATTRSTRKSSRRRTLGDSPVPSSDYHTQTLTQLLGPRKSAQDSDDGQSNGSFDEWLGEPGSPGLPSKISGSPSPARSTVATEKGASRDASVIPATPARHIRFEIPSTSQQSTPAASMLARYGPLGEDPSPLKGRSPNIAAMPDTLPGKPTLKPARSVTPRRPRLLVEDTYATESLGSSSSLPLETTPSRTRVARIAEEEEGGELGIVSSSASPSEHVSTPTKQRRRGKASSVLGEQQAKTPSPLEHRKAAKTPSPYKRRTTLLEIPDSDEDEDDHDFVEIDDDDVHPCTSPGFDAGAETQIAMNAVRTPVARTSLRRSETKSSNDTALPSSPPKAALPTVEKRLRRPIHAPVAHSTQAYPAESQRVPLATLQGWTPASVRTDILLPVAPAVLDRLVAGVQVHVALPFKVLAQVVRFWLFDGDVLRYMACPAQGEPTLDGNGAWRYHLGQVYELNNPVGRADMVEEGWIDGSVGRYVYLPPAVVSQLLWNLRHAIFDDNEQPPDHAGGSPPSSASLSQQIEAQIQSDMAHSTQFPTSDGILVPSTPDDDDDEEQDDDDQTTPTKAHPQPFRSSPRPPRRPPAHSPLRRRPVRPSQATTASQASIADDQASSHTPPHHLPPSSSSLSFQDYGGSLALEHPPNALATTTSSSQALLTKSQMLPDSLVTDDPRNPQEIWDSEDDVDAPL